MHIDKWIEKTGKEKGVNIGEKDEEQVIKRPI